MLLIFVALPSATLAIPELPKPGTDLDIVKAIDNIINFLWPIFGAIAGAMFIYAGFLFVTAGDDVGQIKTAKHAFVWGIVGISLALLAFVIPWIIFSILK